MRKFCQLTTASLLPLLLLPPLLHAQDAISSIPAGTTVVVRTVDAIDSKTAEVGKTFRATLDAPLLIDGQEAVRKGADATLRITEAQSAGKLKGKAELTIALVSVNAGARVMTATNSEVSIESGGKGKKSAAKVGGGAAVGAALGGIFGGGKGAAIGAAAGAGAGAAAAMLTGPQVKIPSETVLTFKIQ